MNSYEPFIRQSTKKGEVMSTKTLDALCYALDCDITNIIKFVKE